MTILWSQNSPTGVLYQGYVNLVCTQKYQQDDPSNHHDDHHDVNQLGSQRALPNRILTFFRLLADVRRHKAFWQLGNMADSAGNNVESEWQMCQGNCDEVELFRISLHTTRKQTYGVDKIWRAISKRVSLNKLHIQISAAP